MIWYSMFADMAILAHRQNKSLNISYWAGIFGCLMTGLTQDYLTPFLLLIGGTAFHVGILSSAINLSTSLGQLPSAELTIKFHSRKTVVLLFILLQAMALMVLAGLAFQSIHQPYLFIAV